MLDANGNGLTGWRPNINDKACTLSWKCQRHVPDMSSGQGHVLKSWGQNQMTGHIFFIFCSVMCPLCVLQVSHVSNTLQKTKKKRMQINQIFQICLED